MEVIKKTEQSFEEIKTLTKNCTGIKDRMLVIDRCTRKPQKYLDSIRVEKQLKDDRAKSLAKETKAV